jgi:hypothetical protein
MPSTYEPIATTTLGSAQSSVTFNSFSGYTDIIIVIASKSTGAGDNINIQFNNETTGTNYSTTYMYGDGSTAWSGRFANSNYSWAGRTTNSTWTNSIVQLENYANTSTYKTLLYRGNDSTVGAFAGVSLWRSTSAITEIKLTTGSGSNWVADSMFTLYGIKAA